MLPAAFFAGFPIISFYKTFILNRLELNRMIHADSLTSLISFFNQKYAAILPEPLNGITPAKLEAQLKGAYTHFFVLLKRFSQGKSREFTQIFVVYEMLQETISNLRSAYRLQSVMSIPNRSPSDIIKIIDQYNQEKDRHPVIYYESQLLQSFAQTIITTLTQLDTDSATREIISYWLDYHNLKIINELSYIYQIAVEPLQVYLIRQGSNDIILHIEGILRGDYLNHSSAHPLVAVFDPQSPAQNETRIQSALFGVAKKQLSGFPFRYSYFIAFFILLHLEFHNLNILINGKYHQLAPDELQNMIIGYSFHGE